jgi:hypothetical protein
MTLKGREEEGRKKAASCRGVGQGTTLWLEDRLTPVTIIRYRQYSTLSTEITEPLVFRRKRRDFVDTLILLPLQIILKWADHSPGILSQL